MQRKTFLIAWKIAAQKKNPEVCSADRALASAHQNFVAGIWNSGERVLTSAQNVEHTVNEDH